MHRASSAVLALSQYVLQWHNEENVTITLRQQHVLEMSASVLKLQQHAADREGDPCYILSWLISIFPALLCARMGIRTLHGDPKLDTKGNIPVHESKTHSPRAFQPGATVLRPQFELILLLISSCLA